MLLADFISSLEPLFVIKLLIMYKKRNQPNQRTTNLNKAFKTIFKKQEIKMNIQVSSIYIVTYMYAICKSCSPQPIPKIKLQVGL